MSSSHSDHRTRLEGLRDRLGAAIDGCNDRDLAPLAARYEVVLEKLAVMPDGAEVDRVEAAQAEDAILRLVR